MSHHIPFDIQSQIMKRLPVKSLLRFRPVSKQWKSFIDNPKFIKYYHINNTNPQHHIFLSYDSYDVQTYTSITDNNTFPQQKFPLTAPESLSLLRNAYIIDSVDGLLCFCGDVDSKTVIDSVDGLLCCCGEVDSITEMAVIWNPTIRKSVGIVIPLAKAADVVGFGVCPDTRDPTLVKISVSDYGTRTMWEVEVFTLSTRVWNTVYTDAPFRSCFFLHGQVFVDGVIYFRAGRNFRRSLFNTVISFDLKSKKLGEVCLPERLVHLPYLDVAKVNDSLGLLEYINDGEVLVYGVWTRKDGANKPFTKIFTVRVEGNELYGWVKLFRNNGDIVIELDDNDVDSSIEVYGVEIYGRQREYLCAWSDSTSVRYMETLLLLHESDSIISKQQCVALPSINSMY